MINEIPERSHLCDSRREELASILTHAAGLVMGIVALVMMVVAAGGDPLDLFCVIVFGTSLVLLYGSSTLYHYFTEPAWKARFQAYDHACIYLLIAGSYTPFTLITLGRPWGWTMFTVIWLMAMAGVLVKTCAKSRKDHWLSTALYLVMGWLVVLVIVPLSRGLPGAGMAWLVAGGLAYTVGVVFYAWRRLPFNHAIWHLFVLAGSVCHVLAVCLFVI